MPFATIDGIRTHYQVTGTGPRLLMLAPSAFDSSIQRWSRSFVWKDMRPCETLVNEFQMIAYDRREAGESGGRQELLDWSLYARHAIGLLDHLEIERACLLGSSMGGAVALKVAALFPKRCSALLLHWPVGGYRWMLKMRGIFDTHIAFVKTAGLQGVVERAKKSRAFFNDPECGPWSAAIANDKAFAAAFVRQDTSRYLALVEASRDNLFHDTMPSGATGEELLNINVPTFIMSGDDPAHSHSAAQGLRELMPKATLSPVMPPQQDPRSVGQWIRESVGGR